ncbi:acetyltransferase [Cytophagales bacterium WSM2-2]|nr:acetyltransferase [Cytophagales bacterium WSM2-2]
MIDIRQSTPEDKDQVGEILLSIVRKGDSLAYPPTSSKQELVDYWFASGKRTYTAVSEGKIVGTFFMQDNQPGLGSHIVNAGYATLPNNYGKGVGRAMGLFSLDEARRLGYKAMQFNIVVKTNERAVRLWQDIGFKIIGEIPDAFQHSTLGLVNAYIMYQKL